MTFAACGKEEPDAQPQPAAPVVSESVDDSKPEISDADLPTTESKQAYIRVVREGVADKVPVEMIRGQVHNYIIAMDPAYFNYSCYEGIDSYTYSDWEGELCVYYCVYPYYEITTDELADRIIHQYSGNYADCFTESVKIGNYDALAVYLGEDINAPNYNMHFFLIECDDGCIVIETQFCFEMYEGLYAIMRECFNTFTMIETE